MHDYGMMHNALCCESVLLLAPCLGRGLVLHPSHAGSCSPGGISFAAK